VRGRLDIPQAAYLDGASVRLPGATRLVSSAPA
jgi:hypothetical protein